MRSAYACVLVAIALVGCSGALSEGRAAFARGHYPEAKRVLLEDVGHYEGLDITHQCEFALYLGLVNVELGDVNAARPWLSKAKAIEDAHPHVLANEDWARLQSGLAAIEPPSFVDARSPMLAPTIAEDAAVTRE